MRATERSASDDRANQDAARAVAIPAGLLLVAAAAFAGVITRFALLGDKSLWLDEAWSWYLADRPLSSMVDATARDVHPPLYYAALHFWTQAVGASETALRAPSALASVAAIALVAWAAWRLAGPRVAAAAALLIILNPADLRIAQEARMYPFVALFALGSTLLMAGFVRRPRVVTLAAYVAVAVALAYTHYVAFVVLAVHSALFIAYAASRGRAKETVAWRSARSPPARRSRWRTRRGGGTSSRRTKGWRTSHRPTPPSSRRRCARCSASTRHASSGSCSLSHSSS